jgi:hypothetical protein
VPGSENLPAPTARVLGLVAATDLLAGLVLSLLGVTRDSQVMSIAGVVLLLSGGGVLAFVTWSRNKPEAL